MKIGLIDVDGHNFPNLPLMKLAAWHKQQGDSVEWYEPLLGGHYDRVYMSKVFGFTQDYEWPVHADEVIKGGTGYNIRIVDGKEVYTKDKPLLYPIEHMYPDYEIYGIKDTAYGFMTRGCPRGCDFCIVEKKEGRGETVAPLKEFWKGQKNIVLLDPNVIAVKDWQQNIEQLIESGSYVDFSQGLDIRIMTRKKAEMVSKVKTKMVHFAWDRMKDEKTVTENLRMFREISGYDRHKIHVYVLTGFNTTAEEDLHRIYTLRDLGVSPYVMVYDKEHLPRGHILRKMQRWVNNKMIFNTVKDFKEYQNGKEN